MQRKAIEISRNLKNIAQLTAQNNETISKNPNSDARSERLPMQEQHLSLLQRSLRCLRNIVARIRNRSQTMAYDVNETDLTREIEKIKKRKLKASAMIPPQQQARKTLVLDLDETLVHTTFKKPKRYDFTSELLTNGRKVKAYVQKRFGLQSFLYEMGQIYEIVIFSSSQRQYTDKVMEYLDPKNTIRHVLSRQHCIIVNKYYYLKNLDVLGRDLSQVNITQDNDMAGMLNPDNFYKIDAFYGDPKDRQLLRLAEFLKGLADKESLNSIPTYRKQFQLKLPKASMLLNHNLNFKQRKRKVHCLITCENSKNTLTEESSKISLSEQYNHRPSTQQVNEITVI